MWRNGNYVNGENDACGETAIRIVAIIMPVEKC